MNNNIIITGGAGFIGYHLAKKLVEKNYKIIILDNLSRGNYDNELKNLLKNKNIQFLKKNLQKEIRIKNLKSVKYIYHLAGSVGVKNINKDAYKAFLNNILTLKNIIEFNKNLNNKAKLILFSTSEVYSSLIKKNLVKFPITEKNEIIIENKIIDRDAYYLSKIFNEKLVQLSGFKHIILRPHNIYGPRMGYSHVIPELIKKIFLEKKRNIKKNTVVFSPQHTRAFCYIDDAINQIISLANSKTNNEIYNVGNMREEIKIIELAKKIKKLVFKDSNLLKGSITLGSPKRRVPDMKKTIKKMKSRQFIDIDQGLFKTVNWYLRKLKNEK